MKKLIFEYRADSSGESDFVVAMGEAAIKTKALVSLDSETEETFTTSQRKQLFQTLLTNIRKRGKGDSNIRAYIVDKLQSQITGDRVIWLLSKFLDELRATTAKARKTFSEVLDYTTGASESDKTPAKDSTRDANSGKKGKRQRSPRKDADSERKHKKPKLDDNKSQKDPPTKVARCNHCNSKLHDDDGCTYVKHPDYVMKGSWRDSDVGLAYKNLDPQAPYIKDDRKLNKDMSKFVPIGSDKKPSQKSRQEKIKTGNVQTCCADCATTEPISDTKELDDILVPVTLFHREAKSRSLTAVAVAGHRKSLS